MRPDISADEDLLCACGHPRPAGPHEDLVRVERIAAEQRDLVLLHVTDDADEVVRIVSHCHGLQLAALEVES